MTTTDTPVVLPFKPFKIGLCSGLNYGGPDYRKGIVDVGFDQFRKEKPIYILMAGGLVDSKAILAELKEILAGTPKDKRALAEGKFIREKSEAIKNDLPHIKGVNIHIVTSLAFDGAIGYAIANRLANLRDDIRVNREGGDKLELRQINSLLGVHVPNKASWRSDYFDAAIIRLLKDEKKRSSRGLGDVNVVGCVASSVFNPGDSSDVKRPYFSIPVLRKLSETRTSENQEGIALLYFVTPNPKEVIARTYSFKDLLSNERSIACPPEGASEFQKMIVDILKQKNMAVTVGSIREKLQDSSEVKISVKMVLVALKWLSEQKSTNVWPGVIYIKEARKWDFDMKWFSNVPVYSLPGKDVLKSDKFLIFGCLHGGCRYTDMKFFTEVLPEIILSGKIENFCGAGDFIEGLKHNLPLRGELLGSRKHIVNYTYMEKLAAYLVGMVIFTVFKKKMEEQFAKGFTHSKRGDRLDAVAKAIIKFFMIPGNHDEWEDELGVTALATFRSELVKFLHCNIEKFLSERGVCVNGLYELVQSRIIGLKPGEAYKLPSGISFAMLHPAMSRTKTTSIRPQEMLAFLEENDVSLVFGANFHVAELVHEWIMKYGQRVCVQVGTIKTRSGFEGGKLKVLDTSVAVFKAVSANGRIIMTDGNFRYTPTPNMMEENYKIQDEFEKWIEGFGK